MSKTRAKRSVRTALLAGAMLLAIAPAQAWAQSRAYDIQAQPLADALREYGRTSGHHLLFTEDLVWGKTAPQVRGTYSPDEALNLLLRGSGLRAERTADGTIMIRPATDQGEAQAGSAPADDESAEQQEIVVTGTNIRRVRNETTELITIDRQAIDSSGATTTTRLLETLPQNFALVNQTGTRIPGSPNAGEQGSSVTLRGTGAGTTLVLINGRRIPLGFLGVAADISALPLSAIDRVEIVPDGASAIYGADAVGGVVNFVLKQRLNGAETNMRAGFAEGGVEEYNASQTFGRTWSGGNILVSGNYYRRDLLPSSERSYVPPGTRVSTLFPQDNDWSGLISFRNDFGALSAFADIIYTRRSTFNRSSPNNPSDINQSNRAVNPQLLASAGIDIPLGGDWQVEVAGTHGANRLRLTSDTIVGGPINRRSLFAYDGLNGKVDGSIAHLPGGELRGAFGAEFRRESLDYSIVPGAGASVQGDLAQKVYSTYGELYAPIVGPANAMPLLNRLELSASGRFDHYSRFGSAFSPKIGLMWSPVSGLRLRSSYGTSYRPPQLAQYNTSANSAVAFYGADPQSPSGTSHIFFALGTDVESLRPQKSRNFSLGLEYSPPSNRDFHIGVNYFAIDFRNQIVQPPSNYLVLVADPIAYASLITRNPTSDQVNAAIASGSQGQGFLPFTPAFTPDTAFDPSSIDVLFDLRVRNLSRSITRGLDFTADYAFQSGVGRLSTTANATYLIEAESSLTPTSNAIEGVATIYNPPRWRARGSLGWDDGGASVRVFVNYVGPSKDTRLTPAAPIDSFTTIDTHLGYDFGANRSTGVLRGVRLSLDVQNLFNARPPAIAFLSPISDVGFDPTNASPLGRFVSFQISKAF